MGEDTQESLVTRVKRRVFCERLNLHVGRPVREGEYMYFYCTRCETLNDPIYRGAGLPEELQE